MASQVRQLVLNIFYLQEILCGERENREGRGVSKKEAKSLKKRGNIESEKDERLQNQLD